MAILISTLLFRGGRAAAASVAIEPLSAAEITVETYNFYTVGFIVTSYAESEQNFIITVEHGADAVLVSALDPINLKPGAPRRIALTFAISGDVKDGQVIPAGVSVTAADNPSVTARASVAFVVESKVCAAVGNPTGAVEISNGKPADVSFTLTNCGSNKETFDIRANPDYGIELRTRVQPTELSPGDSRTLRFSIAPTNSRASYSSSVRLQIMNNETPVTETEIPVSVKMTKPLQTRSRYQYIPLAFSLENTLRMHDNFRTTLRISVPLMRDGATTFKSDIWMDSDGAKLETRQQKYDISHNNTRLILGDQSVALPRIIHNSIANYEGRLLSHTFRSGTLSLFNGGGNTNRVSVVKWEQQVSPRFRLGLGHLSESNETGDFSSLSANTFESTYVVNRRMSLDSEITRYHVSGLAPQLSWSGLGFRIGGSYQSDNLQINAFTQTGRRNVSAGDFFRGTEFRLDYDINKSRHVFMDYQRRSAYAARNDNADLELSDSPINRQSGSIGYSQPFYAGIQLFSSMKFSSYSATDQSASVNSSAIRDKSMSMRLSKSISSLTLNTEIETGHKSNSVLTSGYREYGMSGQYNRKKISIGLDMKSTIQFDSSTFANTWRRNRTWTIGYTPPSDKRSFQIGWKRDAGSDSMGGSDVRKRFEVRFQNRFQNGDSIRISYSVQSFQGVKDDTAFFVYSKNVNLRIPYKQYGSVSGIVFEDRNRNGQYDDGDLPIENATIQLGQDLRAKSNAAGIYEIFDVAQGVYALSVVPSSIPAHLSHDPGSEMKVKVKSGKRAAVDIPLQRVFKIEGKIIADNSDIFSTSDMKEPPRLKVILGKDGRTVDYAFSDEKGFFYFEGITQGEYEVTIDSAWLPTGIVCRGGEKRTVMADGNSNVTGITFTIEPEHVETIKTYDNR